MESKIATTCFQWSQPLSPRCSSLLSSSSKRRRIYLHRLDQSAFFGSTPAKLHRSRSYEVLKPRNGSFRRTCSANFDALSDEEFGAFSDDDYCKKIQELTQRFRLSDDENRGHGRATIPDFAEPNWFETGQEPPEWPEIYIPSSIERKVNRFDLPLSLRIIQKKIQFQCQEGLRESAEFENCSVKKAFSSVVFMIRELHSYSLRLREMLFFEDLQSILVHVQKEIHASFVWLFQQVFSHTPMLMVYVLILLANFTVYSMGSNIAIAAPAPPAPVSIVELCDQLHPKFNSAPIKTYSASGRTTSIGGSNGGGGKVRSIGGGIGDDGQFDPFLNASVPSVRTRTEAEAISREEEEMGLWNLVLEDAWRMQEWGIEELDHETMQKFVSPVVAKIESDENPEYLRTELLYQSGILQEPNNSLLLANYAQFLYIVSHDYDRAEEYFKRAVAEEPPDAVAYDKYATFLWRVRNDLWAAEEAYLEAISADPNNSHYAANYANFLWNTGGEDTCFPLDSSDTAQET